MREDIKSIIAEVIIAGVENDMCCRAISRAAGAWLWLICRIEDMLGAKS